MPEYIVALDQGTTSSKAVLFDGQGKLLDIAQKEFEQIYPQPGWVEHDPLEIWSSQREVFAHLLRSNQLHASQIRAIGITNQRETAIVWDRTTGQPVCNAIVWQDRRTAPICQSLEQGGLSEYIRQNTGLVIDAYFSASKVKWILDNVEGAREKAQRGELLFGTVDSWLVWNMTSGKVHATDYSNASRTMVYNIRERQWDTKLLEVLGIPLSMLPEVRDSSGDFGEFEYDGSRIPIRGVAGDQQAALFGQTCLEDGMTKNTYGTGCF
ncbi:MAG TPA: FGGY family carbohydrate kinase, partial [bacterium]|nr:FGGY family carbohydrate kinase [bacterium]